MMGKTKKGDSTTSTSLFVSTLPASDVEDMQDPASHRRTNIENALALNQTYQDFVEKNMNECIRILNENRTQQGMLQDALNELRETGKSKPTLTALKVPAGIFMPPYFRDKANMFPPIALETQRIHEQYQTYSPLDEPARKWPDVEKNKMKESIREMAMELRTKPLLQRKDLLMEKLVPYQIEKEAELPVEVSDIKVEIERKDREIDKITRHSTTDELLRSISLEDIDWLRISNFDLSGKRTPFVCQLMWINQLKPGWNLTDWDTKETAKLKQIMAPIEHEPSRKISWEEVSELLGAGRPPFVVFEKYQSELNVQMVKRDWSVEEDGLLNRVVEHCRSGEYIPWVQVAYFMDGRSMYACESRYNRHVRAVVRKGSWLVEEDMRLLDGVGRFGGKDWSKVSELVGTRNEIQCRDRWRNVLDANVNHGPWTTEEDERIKFGVEVFGHDNPAKISHLIPGRTGAMVMKRIGYLRRMGPRPVNNKKVFMATGQQYWKNEVGDAYPLLGGPDSSQDKTEQFLFSLPDDLRFTVYEKLSDIRAKLFAQTLKRGKPVDIQEQEIIGASLRPIRNLPSNVMVSDADKKLMKAMHVNIHTANMQHRLEFLLSYSKQKMEFGDAPCTPLVSASHDTDLSHLVPRKHAMPSINTLCSLQKIFTSFPPDPDPLEDFDAELDDDLDISLASRIRIQKTPRSGYLVSPTKMVMPGYGMRTRAAIENGSDRVESPVSRVQPASRPAKRRPGRPRKPDPPPPKKARVFPDQPSWHPKVAVGSDYERFYERVRSALFWPTLLSTDVLFEDDAVQVVN